MLSGPGACGWGSVFAEDPYRQPREGLSAMAKIADQRAERATKVTSPLIELRGAEKVYRTGKLEYAALRGELTWRSGLGRWCP